MYKKIMSWIILLGIIVMVIGFIMYFSAPTSETGKTAGNVGMWALVIWSCCAGWMAYDPKKD